MALQAFALPGSCLELPELSQARRIMGLGGTMDTVYCTMCVPLFAQYINSKLYCIVFYVIFLGGVGTLDFRMFRHVTVNAVKLLFFSAKKNLTHQLQKSGWASTGKCQKDLTHPLLSRGLFLILHPKMKSTQK